MRWKKDTPGERTQKCAEQFAYTGTQFGLKNCWTAWAAAEPYWCRAHEHTEKTPGTKVCVSWFTDGALICPRCRPAVVPSELAYVFVYRELDHKACLVIVHDTVRDLVKGIEYGTRVLIGRVEKGASVFVKRADDQTPFRTEQECRKRPCDIAVSLLTMWGYPALTTWCSLPERTTPVSCEKVPGAESWRLSVPPPTTDTEALAMDAHRTAGTSGSDAVDDALQAAIKRAAKPSVNGNHTPKRGE